MGYEMLRPPQSTADSSTKLVGRIRRLCGGHGASERLELYSLAVTPSLEEKIFLGRNRGNLSPFSLEPYPPKMEWVLFF
jgi:hypothetical protein